jgi:ABC-type Mn2+/Zn2+ transport system ATPase subunit
MPGNQKSARKLNSGREILKGIDLEVARAVHAIMGPNSSKSTLAAVLAGREGEITEAACAISAMTSSRCRPTSGRGGVFSPSSARSRSRG